jgi:outer membrane protein OmpA-like peptidoglycan-associated protein
VKRTITVVLSLFILFSAIGLTGYWLYRRLESMDAKLQQLEWKVDRTGQDASAAAARAEAANIQATGAADSAKAAASARAQAEQLQKHAESIQAQAETAARQAKDEMVQMRQEREAELNHMQEVLSHIVETRRTQNGMVISLTDNTFKFDFDSSDLKPKNRELLSRIAGILLASKSYGLSVFGYTDDVGTADYNQKLSVRRAKAVRDYLVESGIDPGIVTVKGYGKTSPMLQGTSEAVRAKNRRVEIALTDTTIRYDISGSPR